MATKGGSSQSGTTNMYESAIAGSVGMHTYILRTGRMDESAIVGSVNMLTYTLKTSRMDVLAIVIWSTHSLTS
jgi:hypothetical protein